MQREARAETRALRRGADHERSRTRCVPAGKTPLTSAVEQAANVLDYTNKPALSWW
jgi:hypothetical protein